jgi:replicative superfamily II helicase
MSFRGLFIGVDRYASPGVKWLTCARRDAIALHGLFTDSMGGETVLLTDGQATSAAIREEFRKLEAASPDDIAVIAFSGHGSETHQIVTYDTDPYDLDGTTISLATLGEWFARIPCHRLLIVLDCCFSGGIDAKALQVHTRDRSLESVDSALNRISGQGRVVLTASGPTQPAWENSRLGHGFLTLYLIEALQGPAEIREGDRIGLLRLLDYVSRRVTDAASQIRREQHPAIRGTFDGQYSWPVMTPGAIYRTAFPEDGEAVATSDIASLAAFGFPQTILDAWAGDIPCLNQLQLEAVNDYGVLRGQHLVTSAPTSSGKTMIGELAAIKGALQRHRTLFLMPLKALVNDKLLQFQRVYGPFGIRTVEATGETDDISPLMRGQFDIALLTYEKFTALALTHPHVIEQVGTIVVDEVQMIADKSRGANLEFILTLLRMRARDGVEPQIIALSAVIGDTNGLERWLGGRLLRRNERPVPLDEGIIAPSGRFVFFDGDSGRASSHERFIQPIYDEGKHRDWVIPLVRKLVSENKQVIVFRESTGETRHGADYLADSLGLPAATGAIADLPRGDPSQATLHLRQVLARGVAFHNSHLRRDERRAIEEHFRKRETQLRVIVATTTLAMGVNTPASAVVIVGLEHPTADGQVPYSVAEYKNIVGRAGRLGYAERGASYLIATSPNEEQYYWHNYVSAVPEDLVSRFLDADPRTLVIRVLVAAGRNGVTGDGIIDFLECSFAVFQKRAAGAAAGWDRHALERALSDLLRHGMIERGDETRLHLTDLGRLAGESAIEIETLIRAVDCLRRLRPEEITDPALIALAQTSIELDAVSLSVNKKSTQKEPRHWPEQLLRQGISRTILSFIEMTSSQALQALTRCKKAAVCLYYVSGMAMSEIENAVSQFGGAFGGSAGPIMSVTERTCDVLPTMARAAELLHPGLQLGDRQHRLVFRLGFGIQGPAVDLAKYAERALDRSDYRRLCDARLTERDRLIAADDATLLPLLANDTRKLMALRAALAKWSQVRPPRPAVPLPPYEA